MTTTDTHQHRKHAKFSASASDRWITCPASIKMEETYPSTTNAASEEGTKAHEIAEAILLGKPYPKDDQEMVRHGKEYAEYINEIAGIDGKVYTERRVYFGDAINQPKDLAFGTCDNIVVFDTELHIIDYKYGFNEVSAENNHQLMMYALGVLCNTDKHFNTVHLHIYQPRVNNITSWVTNERDLYYFSNRAELAAREALSDNPRFNPQPKACRWCRAKGDCKALADTVIEDFEVLEDKNANAETLDNDDIAYFLSKADTIRHFLKAVEDNAFKRALAGNTLKGYKLVNKKARAKWNDKAIKELPEKLGDAAFRPPELITITDAKKLIPIDEIVDLTSKNAEGYALVPASDKRPEATITKADVFVKLD